MDDILVVNHNLWNPEQALQPYPYTCELLSPDTPIHFAGLRVYLVAAGDYRRMMCFPYIRDDKLLKWLPPTAPHSFKLKSEVIIGAFLRVIYLCPSPSDTSDALIHTFRHWRSLGWQPAVLRHLYTTAVARAFSRRSSSVASLPVRRDRKAVSIPLPFSCGRDLNLHLFKYIRRRFHEIFEAIIDLPLTWHYGIK